MWQLSYTLSLAFKAFMNFYYPYNLRERDKHTHTHTCSHVKYILTCIHILIDFNSVYWKRVVVVIVIVVNVAGAFPYFAALYCVIVQNIILLIFGLWTDFDSQFFYVYIYCHFSCRCLSCCSFITTHNPRVLVDFIQALYLPTQYGKKNTRNHKQTNTHCK